MDGFLAFFFSAVLIFFGFLIWIIPIILIARSNRTTGKEKIFWLLVVLFISWFAWVFYMLLAPLKEKTRPANRQY
jgi:uncharacterized membrane protein